MNSQSVDKFHIWTKDNTFRTSYNDMRYNKPELPKNYAVPGYQGFVPYIKAENLYGRPYTSITKEAFQNPALGKNKNGLASTGFNYHERVQIDNSALATSHKYGVTSMPKSDPCWSLNEWKSSTKNSYLNPKDHVNPTYKKIEDNDRYLVSIRASTAQSGFGKNYQTGDGNGWVPDQVIHSDQNRTEYRLQFNQKNNFHRTPTLHKVRKLKQIERNYKHT